MSFRKLQLHGSRIAGVVLPIAMLTSGCAPAALRTAEPAAALPKVDCVAGTQAIAAEISPRGTVGVFVLDDGRLAIVDAETGSSSCFDNACTSELHAPDSGFEPEHPGSSFPAGARAAGASESDCRDRPCSDSLRERVSWHPAGRHFVTANRARACLWDGAARAVLQEVHLNARFEWSHDLQFSPDGAIVALARGQHALLWNYRDGRLEADRGREEIRDVFRSIQRLAWHPNSWVLATAGSVTAGSRGTGTELPSSEVIRFWNAMNGRSGFALDAMKQPIGGLAWSHDGRQFAAFDHSGGIALWQTTGGSLQATAASRVPAHITGMDISPAGDEVAVATSDGRLLEGRAGGHVEERQLRAGSILRATYLGDRELLIVGNAGAVHCPCGCENSTVLRPRGGGVLAAMKLDGNTVVIATTGARLERSTLPAVTSKCGPRSMPLAEAAPIVASASGDCRRPDNSKLREREADAEFRRLFPAPGWASGRDPRPPVIDQMAAACFVLHASRDYNERYMVASVFIAPLVVPEGLSRDDRVEWVRKLMGGSQRAGLGPAPEYSSDCPERLLRAAEQIATALEEGVPERSTVLDEVNAARQKLARERACVLAKWGPGATFR